MRSPSRVARCSAGGATYKASSGVAPVLPTQMSSERSCPALKGTELVSKSRRCMSRRSVTDTGAPVRRPISAARAVRRVAPSVCVSVWRRWELCSARSDSRRLSERRVVEIPSTSLDAIPSVRFRHHCIERCGGSLAEIAIIRSPAVLMRAAVCSPIAGCQPTTPCGT